MIRQLSKSAERKLKLKAKTQSLIIPHSAGTMRLGVKAFKRSVEHLPKSVKSQLIREYKDYSWQRGKDELTRMQRQSKTS